MNETDVEAELLQMKLKMIELTCLVDRLMAIVETQSSQMDSLIKITQQLTKNNLCH